MWYVYKHTRLDTNEVFYIGIGKTKNFKRAYTKFNRNGFWYNVTNRCAWVAEIISKDLTFEEACTEEVLLIKTYGRRNTNLGTLVNLTNGGEGADGVVMSEETKIKISKSHKGKKLSVEHANIIRNACIKANTGRRITQETKDKIRQKALGRKANNITKEKMSITRKGRKLTEKDKLNKSLCSGRARIILDTETGIFFSSILEASKAFEVKRLTLYAQIVTKKKLGKRIIFI